MTKPIYMTEDKLISTLSQTLHDLNDIRRKQNSRLLAPEELLYALDVVSDDLYSLLKKMWDEEKRLIKSEDVLSTQK